MALRLLSNIVGFPPATHRYRMIRMMFNKLLVVLLLLHAVMLCIQSQETRSREAASPQEVKEKGKAKVDANSKYLAECSLRLSQSVSRSPSQSVSQSASQSDSQSQSQSQSQSLLFSFSFPCMRSLFSAHIHNYPTTDGVLSLSAENSTWENLPSLCEEGANTPLTNTDTSSYTQHRVAIARRGECSFDTKAKVATRNGNSLLIIVNVDEQLFPMGAADDSYRSNFPVVLIGNKAWTEVSGALINLAKKENTLVDEQCLSKHSLNNDIYVGIVWHQEAVRDAPNIPFKDHAKAIPIRRNEEYFKVVAGALLSSLIVGLLVAGFPSSITNGDRAQMLIMLFVVLSVFVFMRMGTLRLMENRDNGLLAQFNHRETDELIFEDLIRSFDMTNIYMYTLQGKNIMQRLSLSLENYDHALFIHPPLFVAFSAFLQRYFGLPLPLIPIVMQSIGIVALMTTCAEISEVLSSINGSPEKYALMLFNYSSSVFLTCPILWFMSQKIWIDNGLLMAVLVTVAGHMKLARLTVSASSWTTKFGLQLVSGMICFGVSINCKITALGLLPFLILWIALLEFIDSVIKNDCSMRNLTVNISIDVLGFFVGMIGSASPWILLYWWTTGSFLPSAWPSKDMIERFPFVRAAVNKPWYYYLTSVANLSPLHFLGFCFVVLHIIQGFMSVSKFLSSNKKFEVTNPLTKIICLRLVCLCVAVWPITFIVALSGLGYLGAGFQLRFLAPMLPGTAILTALSIATLSKENAAIFNMIFNTLLLLATCSGFYYGVLYPTMYGDIQYGTFEIISSILTNEYKQLHSRDAATDMLSFMKHFGLKLQA